MAYLDNIRSGWGLARRYIGGTGRPIGSRDFLNRETLRAFRSDIMSQRMTRVQPIKMLGANKGPTPIKLKNVFSEGASTNPLKTLRPLPELPKL